MGKKLTKRQRIERKKKNTQNKIKSLERQDALGINRKKLRFGLNPKVWVTLKIISIVSIPVVYILYSPLLIVCMIFSVLLIIPAKMAERNINHTFIKSRHMKIHTLDSIIAIIVIIIGFVSAIISSGTKKKMPFSKRSDDIVKVLENIGSCSTGSHSVIQKYTNKMKAPSFGNAPPPDGMPPAGEMKKFEVSDLPIEMVFSMAVSSVNSVLTFMVPLGGVITLVLYYRRKKKFDRDMDEIVIDKLPDLNDEEFEKLFTYGYEIEAECNDNTISEPDNNLNE